MVEEAREVIDIGGVAWVWIVDGGGQDSAGYI
jgi:hypothetical protein